jgi:3-hydroxybutyryl-CoA dehydrogenase
VEIRNVGVVGLGTMGAGIAEVFARAGFAVTAAEADDALLEAGRGRLLGSVRRAADKGRLTVEEAEAIAGRYSFSTRLDALATADLVVEAVPERLDVKAALFADLDRICSAGAVLATNTSSLPVTAIAAGTGRAARVVGLHFFNPAPVMRLVEVVTTVLTEPSVAAGAEDLARRCGKTPVVVTDRAGFIANALLLPYLNDAASYVEKGRVSAAALDAAVVESTGLPMGPLALMDLIGLDVCVAILDVLWEEFRDGRYAATPLLRRLVMARRFGRKSGRGWHAYDGSDATSSAATVFDPTGLLDAHLADGRRMVADGYADEAAIDTAMRLGCGYPDGLFGLRGVSAR